MDIQDQAHKPRRTPAEARPLERRGLPPQPLWVLLVLTGIVSASISLGFAFLTDRCPLPDTVTEGIAFVMLAVTLFYLFRTCRLTARWLPSLLLLIAIPLCFLMGSVVPVMTATAVVFCTAQAALLLAICPASTLYWMPIVPLGSYAVSLLLCRDPLLALTCLIPFPAAAALAFGTRSCASGPDKITRVGVICLTSLVLGVTVLVPVLIGLAQSLDGGLSALPELLDRIREEETARIMEMSKAAAETIGSRPGPLSGLLGSEEALPSITEEEARNTVNSAINMLPAFLVVVFNVTAALSQCALYGSLGSFGYGDSVKGRVLLFKLSHAAGITFLIAFIVSLISAVTSKNSTLAGTVAENITFILQPGLALCGFMRLTVNLVARSRGAVGCLPFIVLLFAPVLLTVGSSLLALYESGALVLELFLVRKSTDDDDPFADSGDQNDSDPF